jgi:hypothetical protein
MRSKKSDRELRKFRKFLDAHLPGGASHISDSDLANLRDLTDPEGKPEVPMELIREMDALLESDYRRLEQWMADSAASGIKFASTAEARSWLLQFRAFLAGNHDGGSL